MKRLALILSLLLAVLASCTRPAQPVPTPEAPQRDTLAAFDTLMQSQPDSALYALLDFNSNHKNLTPFDRHYADLLLSEALFKNDYEQTLRTEVQQAQTYFDSLAAAQPKSDDYTLLSARAHYMNGVGLMEADSVVEACDEYLKTLEIMEEHFVEKELVGYKAKFMALICSRLGELFSNMFMEKQAIYFEKNSLAYCQKAPTSIYGIPKILNSIGNHYDIINNYDSAVLYYDRALCNLSDTTNDIYRDIISNKAFLDFMTTKRADSPIRIIKQQKESAPTEKEKTTRAFTIGSIYFLDNQYDSAIVYLEAVFADTTDYLRQLEAASCLGKIYEKRGEKEKAEKYFRMLAKQTMHEFEEKTEVSQLNSLFQNHISEKQGKDFLNEKRHSKKIWLILLGVVVFMTILLIIIIKLRGKKQKVQLEKDLSETHQKHLEIQKSLSGRLKSSTENLKQEKEKTKSLQKELETIQQQKTWDSLEVFLEEDICKEILASVEGKAFKREMEKSDYQDIILNNTQLARLSTAVEKHFSGFRKMLVDKYPKMDENEFNLCYLYLLNLNDIQISALLNLGYSSLKKRVSKLKKAFKTEKELLRYICDMVM